MQNLMPRHLLLLQRQLQRNRNLIRRILGNVPITTNTGRIQRQNGSLFTATDPGFFIRVWETNVREAGEESHPPKPIVSHDSLGRGGGKGHTAKQVHYVSHHETSQEGQSMMHFRSRSPD